MPHDSQTMPDFNNRAARLTPTQRLHEVTMASLARRPAEPESSVTLSRNAKGAVQIEVTCRSTDLAVSHAEAEQAFDMLCERYPYPSANGGAE